MGLAEVVDSARSFAVLVKVQGPDPKGLKMRKHAFHQYHSGHTTLSASGMILPVNLYNTEVARAMIGGDQDFDLVLTVASVVEPFLLSQHREHVFQGSVQMIPRARIDIMIEGMVNSEREGSWFPAQLLSLVDVPVSSIALQSLIEASSGSKDNGWDVGWSLASHDNGPQPATDIIQNQIQHESNFFMENKGHLQVAESYNPTFMAKSATRVAVLAVSFRAQILRDLTLSSLTDSGEFLLAVGSPFGVLSPAHFLNSISTGSIANCYPPGSYPRSLLLADIRCLPGMEGSPVFDKHGHLTGILIRPLRQKNINAEIQLVIPWEAMTTACSNLLLKEFHNKGKDANSGNGTLCTKLERGLICQSHEQSGSCYNTLNQFAGDASPELLVEHAKASICLIAINDGVWASGIVLNDHGLVLTNAHLLEPWRFEKASLNGRQKNSEPEERVGSSFIGKRMDKYKKGNSMALKLLKDAPMFVSDDVVGYKRGYFDGICGQISVRLDHLDPWVWYPAKVVYISYGPLDIALLQLEYAPDKLCPIVPDFTCPSLGSRAFVIGHKLLGPKCGLPPSICSGVIAKVVKTKITSFDKSILQRDPEFPAMLETTAAVHPGGSGGAVVNSNGLMIGLVTSNARHSGGTAIPHLNFSIPCTVLAPIFVFARDTRNVSILKNLEKTNGELSSVWELMPPLSPKQSPSLPSRVEGNNDEGKGSRFAKFIAESHKMLKSSSPEVSKAERFHNMVIPSQL